MAMTASVAREGEPQSEINTTPLIDVMLVLLIMLIVSLPPQRDIVTLDMPQKQLVQPPPSRPVRIALSDDGLTSWNGVGVTRAELEAKLDAVAASQPEVMIQATRLVRYSNVIAVLASVQRHGIAKVGVVQGG